MDIIDKLGPLLIRKNGKTMWSGKWAWHMYSVYGLPIELFPDIAQKRLEEDLMALGIWLS